MLVHKLGLSTPLDYGLFVRPSAVQPYRGDADVSEANDPTQSHTKNIMSTESKSIPGSSVGVRDYDLNRSGLPGTGDTGDSDNDAPTVS